jgi:uncharacterized protein (DUF342 family)
VSTGSNEETLPFSLNVSRDRLTLYLDAAGDAHTHADLAAIVRAELENRGYKPVPSADALRACFDRAGDPGSDLIQVAVHQGRPATAPQHGRIEWARPFFDIGFVVDEASGTTDYWTPARQVTVREDEELARIIEPVPGEAGADVFGRRIVAARARSARIVPGQNVRLDRDSNALIANKSGRIRWTGYTLAVDETFTISGDLGLKTGHVNHPGALIIRGNVQQGAQVAAEGDVLVGGTVESASVKTGGSLEVRGGIIGRADTTVRAGGGIRARYVLEADLRARGDIVVGGEIVNSKLETVGGIESITASIIGGSVQAVGGIEVAQAGSESGGLTRLTIVAYPDLDPLVQEQRALREAKELELARHRQVAEVLLPRRDRLPAPKKKQLLETIEAMEALRSEIAAVQLELDHLQEEIDERTKPEIFIKKMLYSNTVITILDTMLKVPANLPGPLRARVKGGKILVTPGR